VQWLAGHQAFTGCPAAAEIGKSMQKLLNWLAGFSVVGFLIAPASAGDYASSYRDRPYLHEVIGNWNGLYIGASVGYSYGSTDVTHVWTDVTPSDTRDRYSVDQDGLNASLSVGYDLMLGGRFVGGVFADYTFGSIKDRLTLATPGNVGLRLRLEDDWAVGGRLGIVHDGALFYFAAGYTAMNVSFDGFDESLHGYFLGGGVEKDITHKFRLKLEYRYADYGSENFYSNAGCCAESVDIGTSVHSVRLGMSYMFGHRETHYHEPLK
jgi:outer membrane immunogenic protein